MQCCNVMHFALNISQKTVSLAEKDIVFHSFVRCCIIIMKVDKIKGFSRTRWQRIWLRVSIKKNKFHGFSTRISMISSVIRACDLRAFHSTISPNYFFFSKKKPHKNNYNKNCLTINFRLIVRIEALMQHIGHTISVTFMRKVSEGKTKKKHNKQLQRNLLRKNADWSRWTIFVYWIIANT